MHKHFFSSIILLTTLVTLSVSCKKNILFDEVQNIPDRQWPADKAVSFNVSVSDTLAVYDFFIHCRNSNSYEYSNLWLFIETIAPSGESIHDTLEITLSDETGSWLGQGFSSVNTMIVPYKTNIRFPYRGIYIFKIKQGMRKEVLEDILNIGLQVQVRNH